MTSDIPRLSIGLPVYNGERYLRQALDAILTQSFSDFELIISDNASTDQTAEICQEYALKDARIRYVRQSENLGAADNFNYVFTQARGEYFKWAAHDDLLEPDFLEACIAVLDSDPFVILAYSKVCKIDIRGDKTGAYDYNLRVNDERAHIRFSDLILINHFCVAVFGVARTAVMAKTPLIGKFVGSDRTLLAELGLRGRLVEVPEYLFNRRDHPLASTNRFKHRRRLGWFDPHQKNKIHFPYWRNGYEHLRSVLRVPMDGKEKIRCFGIGLYWFWARRKVLLDDLIGAALLAFPMLASLKHGRSSLKKSMRE